MSVNPQQNATLTRSQNPLPSEQAVNADNITLHLTGARRSTTIAAVASDTVDISLPNETGSTLCRSIYVTVAGNICLALADDDPTQANTGVAGGPQIVPVVVGQLLPFVCRGILFTGTTASGLVLF
jgi:hypothetical protein